MIKYRKRNDGLYVCTESFDYFSPRAAVAVLLLALGNFSFWLQTATQ